MRWMRRVAPPGRGAPRLPRRSVWSERLGERSESIRAVEAGVCVAEAEEPLLGSPDVGAGAGAGDGFILIDYSGLQKINKEKPVRK